MGFQESLQKVARINRVFPDETQFRPTSQIREAPEQVSPHAFQASILPVTRRQSIARSYVLAKGKWHRFTTVGLNFRIESNERIAIGTEILVR